MSEPTAEYRVPGRPGVKQSQVDQACDALLLKGERPTIEKVRQAIGGSPNSLLELVDDWWRRLGKRVERGSAAFERLPGTLALHAEAFFLAAVDEARSVVLAEEADRRDVLAKEEDRLRLRAHVLTQREQEFAAKLEQRERSVTVLEEQLRAQRTLLEKTLATKDALQRQVDELRITVATLQARHAAALATPRVRGAPGARKPLRRARTVTGTAGARKRKESKKRRARRGR
jgi:hypothetical protein